MKTLKNHNQDASTRKDEEIVSNGNSVFTHPDTQTQDDAILKWKEQVLTFNKGHPFINAVEGFEESIRQAERKRILEILKKYFEDEPVTFILLEKQISEEEIDALAGEKLI